MKHSPFCKQLKDALLGDRQTRTLANFVLFRDPIGGGVSVLDTRGYELRAKGLANGGDYSELKAHQKLAKHAPKNVRPAPITDEELSFIE